MGDVRHTILLFFVLPAHVTEAQYTAANQVTLQVLYDKKEALIALLETTTGIMRIDNELTQYGREKLTTPKY